MFSRKLALRMIQHKCTQQPKRRLREVFTDSQCKLRFFASSASQESSSSATSRRRGNLLIGFGWALLGLLAVDQVLQYKQEQEAKEHRRMLYHMQEESNQENEAQWDKSLPAIFKCKIVHTEVSLDGTKMLRGVGVGEVVDVLEENTGPNKAYHVCRNPASNRPGSVGWYPIQYLERID